MSQPMDIIIMTRDLISEIVKLHYTILQEFPNFTKLFYMCIISLVIYRILKYVVVKSINLLKFLLKLLTYSLVMSILAWAVLNLNSPVQIEKN
jgi:hypothetical protein